MNEQKKYEVIKSLADHPAPNKQRAALTLGCTVRHVNRMLKGYKEQGKVFFIHGNRGRKPANTIPENTRHLIVDLYRAKYYDANFEHFTELLRKHEDIHISPSSVMSILEAEYILSPKVTKAKKKRVREQLKADMIAAKTQKEADQIQTNLVAVEEAHSRRSRAAYFGELEQMDATPYEWIPGQIWHLHLAIDDATGRIVGGWFDTQETLNGYYHVFYQILTIYGICNGIFNHTLLCEFHQGKLLLHLTIPFEEKPKTNLPSDNLKYYRQRKQMTTRQLAEKLDIVPSTVAMYENGKHPIPYDVAIKLADVLEIEASLLYDDFSRFLAVPYTEALKSVRTALGLSQKAFAERIGVVPSYYYKIEEGNRRPSRKAYQKIYATLKTTSLQTSLLGEHPLQ